MILRNYKPIVATLATAGLLVAGLLVLLNGDPQTASADVAELFVSPAGAGSCLQSDPCDLQTAVGMAGSGDTIYVASGTYTGTGDAVVELFESVALRGGWDGAPAGDVALDPLAYPTTLDGESERRGVYLEGVGVEITPTLEGFVVTRGNATNAVDTKKGGGIYVVSAMPLIAGNVITGNTALVGEGQGFGGGIFLTGVSASTLITDNTFVNNTAGTSNAGNGGGLSMLFGTATIEGNTFRSNVATPGNGFGGGVHLLRSSATIVRNLFVGNDAGRGYGGGFYGQISEATLSRNVFLGNTADYGAVSLEGIAPFTMTNNLVVHNEGGIFSRGNATYITAGTLANNTIAYNGSHAIYVGVNNGNYSVLTLANNIIVSHTTGIYVVEAATNQVTATHTLLYENGTDIAGALVSSTDQITGSDPRFGNPPGLDYGLSAGSPAIDAGIAIPWLTIDIDGKPRPMGAGYDIGAAEAPVRIYLPALLSGHQP